MKLTVLGTAIAACLMSTASMAQRMNADDLKWVNQCINDNRNEPGATPEVVRAYCLCMNEKMDSGETRSVTQWEKANPGARKDCEVKSGWN